jgi:DNA-binding Xre family transcriptional regulator
LKNKATKKIISNVKVKIKVYSGKKYKTYTVKTNKKGIAKINTNKLKTGKHKVVISSKNSNYLISAKSMITIQK